MEPAVTESLIQGLGLMALGMTVVFSFLLLLVGVLIGMSRLASRLEPPPQVALPAMRAEPGDPRVAAAIAAAVRLYRQRHPGGPS